MAFAASSGAPFIDFIIGDRFTTPPELASLYTEKLVVMPRSYHANSHATRFGDVRCLAEREKSGGGRGGVRFAAFNKFFKITPEIVSAWGRILEAVPNSTLTLVSSVFTDVAVENLRRELLSWNVAPERVGVIEATDARRHVKRNGRFDVHLDTHLQSGHTTAVDALWSGMPTLSCDIALFF